MIQIFDNIPSIVDKVDLTTLVDKNKLTPQQYEAVQQSQSLRQEFKAMMNIDKVIELTTIEDGLVNYTQTFENYLKTNVDMLQIIGYNKSAQLPIFQYQTFISKKEKSYSTKGRELPEAFAAEILIARYAFAFAFLCDSIKYINKVKTHFLNYATPEVTIINYMTENQQKEANFQLSDFKKSVDNTLSRFKEGYIKISKLNNVKNDLLYFLVQKQEYLVPELKATTLYSIKLLFESNANSIYLEQLVVELCQKKDNYLKIAQLAKCNVAKLQDVNKRFLEIKEEIDTKFLEFFEVAIPYFSGLGMTYLCKYYQNCMKDDRLPEGKTHTQLSGEIYQMSNQLLQLNQVISGFKSKISEKHQLNYAQQIFKQLVFPIASKLVQIYEQKQNTLYLLDTAEKIFMSIPSLDYYQDIAPITI